MSELNMKARALVDATQFADEPSVADCDRIHAAISARIAVGVAVGTVALLGAESAAASTVAAPAASGVVAGTLAAAPAVPVAQALGALGATAAPALGGGGVGGGSAALGITSSAAISAKVAAWVLAIGLTGGAVGMTAKHMIHSGPPPVAATTSSNAGGPGGVATSPVRAGSDFSSAPRSVEVPSNDPGGNPPGETRVIVAPPERAPDPKERSGSPSALPPAAHHVEETRSWLDTPQTLSGHAQALDAELELLRRAHAALNEGRAEDALAALEEHETRFRDGVLAEDRAAQRVLALCALGRSAAARDEGQRFVSSHPRSPHVPAIRSSCAFVGDPRH